jgi:hypothetical protein
VYAGFKGIFKVDGKENYILKRLSLYLRTDKKFDNFNVDTLFYNAHTVKKGTWKVEPLRLNRNTGSIQTEGIVRYQWK